MDVSLPFLYKVLMTECGRSTSVSCRLLSDMTTFAIGDVR